NGSGGLGCRVDPDSSHEPVTRCVTSSSGKLPPPRHATRDTPPPAGGEGPISFLPAFPRRGGAKRRGGWLTSSLHPACYAGTPPLAGGEKIFLSRVRPLQLIDV